jgi:WhiB family redox-sensing transcriptional regulator
MSLASILPSVEQDEWLASAECLGVDPEIFYVEKGGSSAEAKAICRSCPVQEQCLEYAIEHHERHGVWGGHSQPELRILRRDRRRATRGQAQRAN